MTVHVLVDCFVITIASHTSRLVEAIFQSLKAAAQMCLSNIKLKDPLFSISFLIQTLFLISTLLPLYVHKMRFSNRKNMKANWKFIHIRGRPKQQPDKFQTIRGKVFVCIWIALFSLTLSISLSLESTCYCIRCCGTCFQTLVYCPWCWTLSERIQVLRYSHRTLIDFASAFSDVSSFHRL